MKKPIPTFESDKDAEEFIDTADLTKFDLSGGQIVQFEMRPKDTAITLRLPEPMLKALRDKAKTIGIPYQRFIRIAIANALGEKTR